MLRLALGEDVFENYIQNSEIYIDKSLFIQDIIDNTNKVLLITRPRRFGKTLNMTMLKAFFDVKNNEQKHQYAKYFENLNIWKCDDKYLSHFGKHPVVFMTLKGGSNRNWEDCYDWLKLKIAQVFKDHRVIIDSLNEEDKKYYNDILLETANRVKFANAIGDLLRWLHRYYGEMPILLIDEYDAPLNDGFNNDYSIKIVDFMRDMFSYAMKTNTSLQKAVLTGLTKIAGKSLFSTLNHFTSYNILEDEFSQYFGFKEDEVQYAIKKSGTHHTMEEISKWYNGYRFGKTTPIYNPWSIMNVCNTPQSFLKPYWIFTSSEESLGKVLNHTTMDTKEQLYALAKREALELPLHDDVTFETVKTNSDVLWTFLLYAGYLTTDNVSENHATFRVPNYEVKKALNETIKRWLTMPIHGTAEVNGMLLSMLHGKEQPFFRKLSIFVLNAFSYFDLTQHEPERVYHAFLLGLLCHIQEDYYFSSNPEAGEGRADILIMPKSRNLSTHAVVLEFKQTDEKKRLEKVTQEALAQIKSKQYIAEAKKRGATEIYAYGIGFCGKDLKMLMEKVRGER